MALQIRRGTEAQRAALSGVDVPASGELLYTTDTKKLYIGDGITDGGLTSGYFDSVEVAGQDTLLATGTNNSLTITAGTNITLITNENTNTLTIEGPATFDGGIVSALTIGEAYSADPVDSFVDFEGTGARVMRMGANVSTSVSGPIIQINAYRDTPANNDTGSEIEFRQSTLGGLDSIIATVKSVVTDITNGSEAGKLVFSVADAQDIVSIDSTGFVGNLTGDVTGDVTGNVYAIDTTLLVDATNKTFSGDLTGNVTGSVTGDVKGSVFADDSTVLVDGPAGVLRGELVGTLTGNVTGSLTTTQMVINGNSITPNADVDIILNTIGSGAVRSEGPLKTSRLIADLSPATAGVFILNGASTNASLVVLSAHNDIGSGSPLSFTSINAPITGSTVNYVRARGTIPSQQSVQTNDYLAVLNFAGYDGASYNDSAQIRATVTSAPSTGIVPGAFEFAVADATGNMGVKMYVEPERVSVTRAFGLATYTTTQRDALTPSFGDVIYNATTNKFQGYQNTGGTTPEWVDLS